MGKPLSALETLLDRCERMIEDTRYEDVRHWRACDPRRRAVGYLPVYAPREIVYAAGCLPVGIVGAGEELEIVRGDACFQSYICHLPRSVVELGLSGRLEAIDGMLFPSTCDVIRNLSGIWKLEFPALFVRYLDFPQNFDREIGGRFYRGMLEELWRGLCALTGRKPEPEALRESIRLYNENRRLVAELYALRAREPWLAPASESYLVLRAGLRLPVEEHSELMRTYMTEARRREARPIDNARIAVRGVFCEQPPVALIRTLERAGCYLVDDDFLPVLHWPPDGVREEGDPLDAMVDAWLDLPLDSASRYTRSSSEKGAKLVRAVEAVQAEGVIFAAPSFCDPALLDRPMLQQACAEAHIPCTSFKYAENTGQLQPIREQAGTFADSIKLWGEA